MKNVKLHSEVEVKHLQLFPFSARRRNRASRCIRILLVLQFSEYRPLIATSEEEC
jgi:hypothetical protein